MNSRYFGAPQSRSRIFICASCGDPELPLRALFERSAGALPRSRRDGFLTADQCTSSGALVPRVAYCLSATAGRHTGTDWSRTYISYNDAVRRLTPSECEGLQGFPISWTDIPLLKGRNTTDCDTPRYHALGNAVTVPLVEWVASMINKAQIAKRNLVNGFTVEDATSTYKDFLHSSRRVMVLHDPNYPIDPKGYNLRWQTGGYAHGTACIDIKAPDAPTTVVEKPLLDVLERQVSSSHYFLSANAAEGILRRVDSQNRTLFGPMDKALRTLVTASRKDKT